MSPTVGHIRRALASAAVWALVLALVPGCLSSAHRVPRSALKQAAAQPPAERGKRVRVIQEFAGTSPPHAQPVHAHTHVVVTSNPHGYPTRHRETVSVGSHGRPGGRLSAVGGGKAAKVASEDAKAWLIVAGALAVVMAATEGARYDGWVDLHPMHPVHLYGPRGEYRQLPLAQITPETARWARAAYVRPSEGPWTHRERAPLNRRGWTYSVLFGAAQIPSGQEYDAGLAMDPDTAEPGFLGHIQLGRFVTHETGVLLDVGLGWRDNAFNNTVFESRNALEVQHLPVELGPLHGGVFGQVGVGLRAEDGPKSSVQRKTFIAGGGGLMQLELTARLAITGRVGYTRIFGENTAEATLGLSIY